MLAPFAPHIAEELWHLMGYNDTVFDAPWPALNEEFLKSDTVNYPIQINGKLRATIELPSDVTAPDAEAAALSPAPAPMTTESCGRAENATSPATRSP